jgi:hypothetical protein
MSLRSRLHKLERTVEASGLLADDVQYQVWRAFYEIALEVLAPFPEVQQEIERRTGVNEPCNLPPNWQRTSSGDDARFSFFQQAFWAALEEFPEARQALDQALNEAFGDEGADDEDWPPGSNSSLASASGGGGSDDLLAGPRES